MNDLYDLSKQSVFKCSLKKKKKRDSNKTDTEIHSLKKKEKEREILENTIQQAAAGLC